MITLSDGHLDTRWGMFSRVVINSGAASQRQAGVPQPLRQRMMAGVCEGVSGPSTRPASESHSKNCVCTQMFAKISSDLKECRGGNREENRIENKK